MPRPKGGRDGKSRSVFLYKIEDDMAEMLKEDGGFDSVSSMFRSWIREMYKVKFPNGRAGHLRTVMTSISEQQKELSAQMQELEKELQIERKAGERIIEQYKQRARKIPSNGYERLQKAWIESNIENMESLFPGMNVDEIYEQLETTTKKMIT